MSSNVSFLGLNSSFDSASLVEQLINIETQNRIAPLNQKVTNLQSESSALDQLSTQIGTVKTALSYSSIKNGTTSLSPKQASTSDSASVAVTATDAATAQSFTINVSQLATSTIRQSDTAIKSDLTNASAISAAHFKGNATLSNGTVTINGVTQTYTEDGTPTLEDIETFLGSFAGVTATYNTGTGKFDLTGITSMGSSGDTSNMLSALGLTNAQISGGNVTGLQNLEAAKKTATLNSLGVTGTKITVNGTDVDIDTGAAGDTIQDLITAINNTSGTKVSAAFDDLNGKIILTNKSTGALSITASGDGSIAALNLNNGGSQTLGDNAEFTISTLNGGATLVSNSNTVEGLIEGMTLTLNQVTSSAVTIGVTESSSGYKTRLNTVITEINKLITRLNTSDTSFNRNFISRIKNTLGALVGDTTNDTYNSFIELGLKSNLDSEGNFTGFSLDATTFDAAYAAAPDEVNKVLWGDSSDPDSIFPGLSDGDQGILVMFQDLMDTYVDPSVTTNGLITQVKDSLSSQIKTTQTKIEREQTSIDNYEARMKKQFAQLDVINARFQQQQSAVASLSQ